MNVGRLKSRPMWQYYFIGTMEKYNFGILDLVLEPRPENVDIFSCRKIIQLFFDKYCPPLFRSPSKNKILQIVDQIERLDIKIAI